MRQPVFKEFNWIATGDWARLRSHKPDSLLDVVVGHTAAISGLDPIQPFEIGFQLLLEIELAQDARQHLRGELGLRCSAVSHDL